MDNKKVIKVCECGCPLIWTFNWAYNEYYCINCGGNYDMFGYKDVEYNKETKKTYGQVKKLWKLIKKDLLPKSRYQKSNCKKCTSKVYHSEHLSKSEIRKNKIAIRYLEGVKGLFDETK